MAVVTTGTVTLRGEEGLGVAVEVLADDGRLRIDSEDGLVGDWKIHNFGIRVLDEGFAIRVEGEEFFLRTEDDAAVAEELHVAAASPRMARLIAARHNPERPLPAEGPVPKPEYKVAEIGFALAGAMVLLGGTFLRGAGSDTPALAEVGGERFWLAFIAGGVLMVAAAVVMSLGGRLARLSALFVLTGVIVGFGLMIGEAVVDVGHFIAYGFIAGGIVVGVAVLFGGTLRSE